MSAWLVTHVAGPPCARAWSACRARSPAAWPGVVV